MKLYHFLAAAVCMFSAGISSAAELAVRSGDTIAFLGASITQFGQDTPCGYITLVIDGLKRSGVEVKPVYAGRAGDTAPMMLARVDRSVISKKPTWMTLNTGMNDVSKQKAVSLNEYRKSIEAICEKVQKANIKIMIFTSTVYERPGCEENKRLVAYNEFLRTFAKERGYLLADLNSMMQKAIEAEKAADKTGRKVRFFTRDGLHMTKKGNILMASGVLAAFGVPQADIDKYAAEWMTYPETTKVNVSFTVDEWRKIEKAAKSKKQKVDAYVRDAALKSAK